MIQKSVTPNTQGIIFTASSQTVRFGVTVKAGTQERGTEVRCKVRHDERACAHCEGVHGLVSSLVCKSVCQSVDQFRTLKNGQV